MEEFLFELLKEYTYQPYIVYGLVAFVMFLSSFGLPVPEEFSIVSLGILSYMGSRPDIYPPPYDGAPHVAVLPSMTVCSLSIYVSDICVYSLGRYFGPSLFSSSWFKKSVSEKRLDTVKAWARRWGRVVPALFRLIPGVRFPGHLMCGALGIKPLTFLIVDAFVIGISVPTQIFLVSYFGESVIGLIKRFQFAIAVLCGLALLVLLRKSLVLLFKRVID